MNELQIFKNPEFGQVKIVKKDGQVQYLIIGGGKVDRFRLLALADRIGMEDEKAAWQIMNLASILFHPQDDMTFNELYGAVAIDITRMNQKTESDLYPKFAKNVRKILGENAELIKRENVQKHQPDSWVQMNGQDIPVEIKLHSFDRKALKQLQRYMNFYNCQVGIAVGESLNVNLPNNIIFVRTGELEE